MLSLLALLSIALSVCFVLLALLAYLCSAIYVSSNCKLCTTTNKYRRCECAEIAIMQSVKTQNKNCKMHFECNNLQTTRIHTITNITHMQSWEPTVWEATVLGVLLLGPAAHSPSLTATWGLSTGRLQFLFYRILPWGVTHLS